MALKTAKLSDVPEGEMPVSKKEAIEFQLDIMENLCPPNRWLMIRYGHILTTVAAAVNCTYLHHYYRDAMNVLHYGRFFSFFPGVIVPAAVTALLHKWLISENIIIQKWACPVCYHVRSGLINLTTGSIYPAIVAPIIAVSYARRMKLDVPPLNSKVGISFVLQKMKPISSKMKIIACLQFFLGGLIADRQIRENSDFNLNINKYIQLYQERIAREKMKSERLLSKGST